MEEKSFLNLIGTFCGWESGINYVVLEFQVKKNGELGNVYVSEGGCTMHGGFDDVTLLNANNWRHFKVKENEDYVLVGNVWSTDVIWKNT